jgi:hypothetical protein
MRERERGQRDNKVQSMTCCLLLLLMNGARYLVQYLLITVFLILSNCNTGFVHYIVASVVCGKPFFNGTERG